MIKDFNTYINEDYFSKLASRKDNGIARKENEITEDSVLSYCDGDYGLPYVVSFRKKGNQTFVDIVGDVVLKKDIEEIPFQFGLVHGVFSCMNCENLTSLQGCPESVTSSFTCTNCKNLKSLEGCPKYVGKNFACSACGEQFTENDVKKLCEVKGKIFL